ncbi:M1 family metallopeptidase [Mucilaginibacter sp. BJC16-A38]|uniref:M1 family metallopeptidase n=1 Tax=Mucilaginibacter phenanthrenivorans TaxID=1234842 RepID=UPI0021583D92|nr:M1 family metallopeptidase [Mucilaginibacter phenanthrenivorans]MCR8558400.1 M1 family metallopeptidase [Mucilaginibacter phenanthrenivorans]
MIKFLNSKRALKFTAIVITSFITHVSMGQSRYKPAELFPALPLLPPGSEYRTATGEPGPAYWQNQSDYVIDVALDDKQNLIKGVMTVTYTNNSPKALADLWMQMEQNVYKKESRGVLSGLFLYKNPAAKTPDGGFEIEGISIAGDKGAEIKYNVYDTRMQLHLPELLKSGQQLSFRIQYQYHFPVNYKNADFLVNRTDLLPTKNGDIYAVAQWYPRMCVLDDVEGWNALPYLGNGEFYLDFGNFKVNITVPSAYIVEGSGDLLNPEEVLTPVALKRWQAAHESEQPVMIRSAKEVGEASSRPSTPTCTWKFQMNNTRDFAWTASKSFVWEALSFKLSTGKKVMACSLYPVESAKKTSWLRSSEYVKFTLQYFSEKWHEYPFNKAVNVASNLDGMEYPGMVFCAAKDTGNMYWAVVNHELGHTWFPMTVGSNERKYAWMDEGFNLFMDMMATKDFNKGEFIGYAEIDSPRMSLFSDKLLPIVSRPDAIPGNQVYPVEYQKTAYLLALLRNHILGPDRFDPAFRKYINDWAFKHPTPWDFFRSIDSSTGEDLTWFWKSMFLENFKLDQSIAKVVAKDNKTFITIENTERAAMPLIVEITYKSGAKERRKFPVEIWEYTGTYTFTADKDEAVAKVVIDPEEVFVDVNRGDNVWGK